MTYEWPPRRQDCAEEGGQFHESRMCDGLDADEAIWFAESKRMGLTSSGAGGEVTRRRSRMVDIVAMLLVAAIAAWAVWW